MVDIQPFRAYLAHKQKYASIVADPYDVVNRAEAMKKAENIPESFFHVNKPEIDVPEAADNPYSELVYQKGKENLALFIEKGWLEQDDSERMYVYAMRMGEHQQFGVVCLSSVKDYEEDRIKKHEQTMPKKVEDRTKLADTQGANAGPVFFSFKDDAEIDQIVLTTAKSEPYFNYTDPDSHVVHRVSGCKTQIWKISKDDSIKLQTLFKTKIPCVYIADGHHRANAAYEVGKRRIQRAKQAGQEVSGKESFNYFMSILFSDNHLKCLNYNRVLKSINDLKPEEFLEKIKAKFNVTEAGNAGEYEPTTEGAGHMYLLLEGKWYSLKAANPEEEQKGNEISNLDVQILTDRILTPVLGIVNLKTDPRIDFVGGIRGYKELEQRCKEDCVAGFLMHAVELGQIFKVADAGQDMPPKSTWFEPKPKSGFIVNVYN